MIHAAALMALCLLGAALLAQGHIAGGRVLFALALVYTAWLYRRMR